MSPQYDTFRAFGCSCFPNIKDFIHHRLQFRSVERTSIDYSLNHKGYKCIDPDGETIISRNVLFNENSVPFARQPTCATQPNSNSQAVSDSQTHFPTIPSTTKSSPIQSCPDALLLNHSANLSTPSSNDQPIEVPTEPTNTHSANKSQILNIQTKGLLWNKGANISL